MQRIDDHNIIYCLDMSVSDLIYSSEYPHTNKNV